MAINANAGIDVLVQAKDEASKIIKQVDNNIQKTLSSIQQRATEVGMTLTKVLTVPITLGAGAIVKFGADFDKSMTESLAIMGDISDQMREKMESTAIEVSKHVNYSAKQAAESYFFLASAGLDAAQSIAALPQVAKFAQAGVFDLATATDMLTDSQSALGLTSKDAAENMENMARISDVLVKANTMANASVREFAEALTNRAAAALRANNKEVEEGVAVLAAFADQGMKGARAGEQLNIMLRDMQNAARDNADEFKRFNINIYDAEGNMNNMADIIADLEKAFSGLSAQQRSATMSALGFTAESAASINMLIGTSEAIRKYEKELKNAQGTTEEIANKQLEHFLAQLDLLKSKVIASALELWMLGQPVLNETVLPALEKIVGKIDSLVKWFSSLSPEMQKAIMITAALTAALGPAALAVAGLAMALKTLAIGPVGIVITGIVGIISVVTILSAKFASLTYEMHGLSGNFNKLDLNAARKELDLTKEKIESLEGKLEEFDIDPKLERNKFRPEIQDVLAQYDMLIKRKEELITKIDSLLKTGEDEKLQALLNKITEMRNKYTLGEISREEYREYLQSIVDDTEQFSEKIRSLAQTELSGLDLTIKLENIDITGGLGGLDGEINDFVKSINDQLARIPKLGEKLGFDKNEILATQISLIESNLEKLYEEAEKTGNLGEKLFDGMLVKLNRFKSDLEQLTFKGIRDNLEKELKNIGVTIDIKNKLRDLEIPPDAFSNLSRNMIEERTEIYVNTIKEMLAAGADTLNRFRGNVDGIGISDGKLPFLDHMISDIKTLKAMDVPRMINLVTEAFQSLYSEGIIKSRGDIQGLSAFAADPLEVQFYNTFLDIITNLYGELDKYEARIAKTETNTKLAESLSIIENKEKLLGDSFDETEAKASAYSAAIEALLPYHALLEDELISLVDDLNNLKQGFSDLSYLKQIDILGQQKDIFGLDDIDVINSRIQIISRAINDMLTSDVEVDKTLMQKWIEELNLFKEELDKLEIDDLFKNLQKEFDLTSAFGGFMDEDYEDVLSKQISLVERYIEQLYSTVGEAGGESSDQLNEWLQILIALRAEYEKLTEEVKETSEFVLQWQKYIGQSLDKFSELLQKTDSPLLQTFGSLISNIEGAFEKGKGFVIDVSGSISSLISSALDTITNSVGNYLTKLKEYEKLSSKGESKFADVHEIYKHYQEWDKNLKKLQGAEGKKINDTLFGGLFGAVTGLMAGLGPIGLLISGVAGLTLGKFAGDKHNKEIEETLEKLKDTWEKLKETLGTTTSDIAGSLSSAFSAENYEGFIDSFSKSLEEMTKQALIKAFMASEAIKPLLDTLSNRITEAVMDGTLSVEERKDITDLYKQITDKSSDFYESLKELGIATKEQTEHTKNLNDELRNVPSWYKIAYRRTQATEGEQVDFNGMELSKNNEGVVNNNNNKGGDIVIQNLNIVTNDPEEFFEKMEKMKERKTFVESGTIFTPAPEFI